MHRITARKGAEMEKDEFTRLVLETEETLFHVSFTLLHNEQDCADVVQEAVVKAFVNRDRLREPDHFKTWLVRILINECYAFLRKRKRYLPLEEEVSASGNLPDSCVKEEYLDLYYAMERLEKRDRICVQLFYMEQYSIRQIARVLKIPEGTVKSRLGRARKQLRKMLEVQAKDDG